MSVLIKTSTVLFANYWFFSNINLVMGKKPDCKAPNGPPDEAFSSDHYGEVGLTRDLSVELARFLHVKIPLEQEDPFCHDLANTSTSRCFRPFCGCTKYTRKKYPKKHAEVVNKALIMFKNLNDVVWKNKKLSEIEDRESLRDFVGSVISIFAAAGVETEEPDLINEINRFGFIFSQNPQKYPVCPLVSENPVYYIYNVNQKADFQEMIINKKVPVIVEFSSNDCGACKILFKTLNNLIRENKGKVYFAYVNLSYDRTMGDGYVGGTLPHTYGFKNGASAGAFTSAQYEPYCKNFISKLLSN